MRRFAAQRLTLRPVPMRSSLRLLNQSKRVKKIGAFGGSAACLQSASWRQNAHASPILPQKELKNMGFSTDLYPTAGLFVTAKALAGVYDDHVNDRPVKAPLYAFHDFVEMIGFQKVWDFEKKYADLLAVETKA
jgi:hypothetical protein